MRDPLNIMEDNCGIEPAESLNQLHEKERYVLMKSVVDSGASVHCANREVAPHLQVVPSAGSKRGQTWSQAGQDGKAIENEGEKSIPLYTLSGAFTPTTYQVADVRKPLTSVSKICDRGNRGIFCKGGGIIQNLANGHCTPFPREGNIYTLSMWIDTQHGAVEASGFPGQS